MKMHEALSGESAGSLAFDTQIGDILEGAKLQFDIPDKRPTGRVSTSRKKRATEALVRRGKEAKSKGSCSFCCGSSGDPFHRVTTCPVRLACGRELNSASWTELIDSRPAETPTEAVLSQSSYESASRDWRTVVVRHIFAAQRREDGTAFHSSVFVVADVFLSGYEKIHDGVSISGRAMAQFASRCKSTGPWLFFNATEERKSAEGHQHPARQGHQAVRQLQSSDQTELCSRTSAWGTSEESEAHWCTYDAFFGCMFASQHARKQSEPELVRCTECPTRAKIAVDWARSRLTPAVSMRVEGKGRELNGWDHVFNFNKSNAVWGTNMYAWKKRDGSLMEEIMSSISTEAMQFGEQFEEHKGMQNNAH
eukprot:scaffold1836_cov181-Pinguiococcus_pyrenoidosus.AAC.2